jgi:hypothetical protein
MGQSHQTCVLYAFGSVNFVRHCLDVILQKGKQFTFRYTWTQNMGTFLCDIFFCMGYQYEISHSNTKRSYILMDSHF